MSSRGPLLRSGARASLLVAAIGAVVATGAPSCNSFTPPPSSGGSELGQGQCGGVTVVSTDYQSTSVAVLGFDGAVLSSSILSSASAKPGLSAALSGDVVLATSPTPAPHFVLLDRSQASVVTWVDALHGGVEAQLAVGTSKWSSNPQDYIETSAHKAYVSRYADNPSPGQTPFDGGGDVLIVEPAAHSIVGRVDMHPAFTDEDPTIQPRPGRMLFVDGKLYVLCAAYSSQFTAQGDSKLVTVDTATDQIIAVTNLTGSHGCDGLALSPNGQRIAVSCTGDFGGKLDPSIDRSAVVVLDRSNMAELSRLPASTFGKNPIGFSIAFATNDVLLFPTFGSLDASPPRRDALVRTTIDGNDHATLLESDKEAVVIDDVRCSNACGACFATDAERAEIDRFPITLGSVGSPQAIGLHDGIGLPPRYLGAIGSSLH